MARTSLTGCLVRNARFEKLNIFLLIAIVIIVNCYHGNLITYGDLRFLEKFMNKKCIHKETRFNVDFLLML